jgi:hypothetical protein
MSTKGGYKITFTGKKFDVNSPSPEQVDPIDIAHALSNLCRFGGHCSQYYSVAEHSVHVSNLFSGSLAKWGLMHDATEAYIGDIVRPVKRQPFMFGYRDLEERLLLVIAERFGLSGHVPDVILYADNAMLVTEMSQIMQTDIDNPILDSHMILDIDLLLLEPAKAKVFFMNRFEELFY